MSRLRLVFSLVAAGLVAVTVAELASTGPSLHSEASAPGAEAAPAAARDPALASSPHDRLSARPSGEVSPAAWGETDANLASRSATAADDVAQLGNGGRGDEQPDPASFEFALLELELELAAMDDAAADRRTASTSARQAAFARGLAVYDRARALAHEPDQAARLREVYDRFAEHMRQLAETMDEESLGSLP